MADLILLADTPTPELTQHQRRTSLSELLQNYQKYCQCLSDVQSELSELLAEFVKALVRIFEVFYILNQSYYCRDKICTSSSLMTQQPDKFIFTSKLIPRTQKGLTITIKLPYVIANVFQNFSVVAYAGKYQKAYIRRHTFYLVIFLTISPRLVLT